jgi:S-DNA-T family DNA segregation ATPase FtsK/SpoIIIE
MAQTSGRKPSSTTKKRTSSGGKKSTHSKAVEQDGALFHEIGLIVFFVAMVFLFLCNFGLIGFAGNLISGFLFGIFGFTAYLAPVVLFLGVSFWSANVGSGAAIRKLAAGITLFLMLGVICSFIAMGADGSDTYDFIYLYENSSTHKAGGGILAGSLAYLFRHYLGAVGASLLVILFSVISFILLTEKSLLVMVRRGGVYWKDRALQERRYRAEMTAKREHMRREDMPRRLLDRDDDDEEPEEEQTETGFTSRLARKEELRQRRGEEKQRKAEERENLKILRMERKVSGVMTDTTLSKPDILRQNSDIHEIILEEAPMSSSVATLDFDMDKIRVNTAHQVAIKQMPVEDDCENLAPYEDSAYEANVSYKGQRLYQEDYQNLKAEQSLYQEADIDANSARYEGNVRYEEDIAYGNGNFDEKQQKFDLKQQILDEKNQAFDEKDQYASEKKRSVAVGNTASESPRKAAPYTAKSPEKNDRAQGKLGQETVPISQGQLFLQKYIFPPLSLLTQGVQKTGESARELRETARHLQQILATFGVNVTVTDVSQGPSVTRYELQPEQGVKVSKIVSLTDDIKLNLAATDIRMEAPIPGKAAIGIEVPNKENMTVALRDLLASKEFKEFPSPLAFAVGKDIGGNVVVSDIARMPHMLIAGATGSGKSVCINTLIMSILYKAHPNDVKLIMIDPKVVELSVYNGIPHLLIPVVTDPKKASAALQWGVSEMTERYQKFADYNVRDLKGFNKKAESLRAEGMENAPSYMPQIVIIVDELADLMMVAPGEVEESICRLAQLARAAGIHLIIATQRPSVDVITGLIKANMPSRTAFAVSSGVDSRTILDMNGAEKLLGKGDMLFYPQGYPKPARIQGAFVSDKEVSDVVDFLKNQRLGNHYVEEVSARIQNVTSSSNEKDNADNGRDEYFEEAGRFIIDKEKASIGMLQRVLKIGFNRAARIMDQLCQYGVVGEEEGTKPRKIQMTSEQFEELLAAEKQNKAG